MAHEYLIKKPAAISMLIGDSFAPGVVRTAEGHYHFCVESYFEDFIAAAWRLKAALLADPNPGLPRELAAHWP
jgi:hypothetical protein